MKNRQENLMMGKIELKMEEPGSKETEHRNYNQTDY